MGGEGGYETYILLANPGTTPAMVTVNYLREGGLLPIVQTYTVPAASRFNVHANLVPGLFDGERFGAFIESTMPIAVERAMYSDAASQPGVFLGRGHGCNGDADSLVNIHIQALSAFGGLEQFLVADRQRSEAELVALLQDNPIDAWDLDNDGLISYYKRGGI